MAWENPVETWQQWVDNKETWVNLATQKTVEQVVEIVPEIPEKLEEILKKYSLFSNWDINNSNTEIDIFEVPNIEELLQAVKKINDYFNLLKRKSEREINNTDKEKKENWKVREAMDYLSSLPMIWNFFQKAEQITTNAEQDTLEMLENWGLEKLVNYKKEIEEKFFPIIEEYKNYLEKLEQELEKKSSYYNTIEQYLETNPNDNNIINIWNQIATEIDNLNKNIQQLKEWQIKQIIQLQIIYPEITQMIQTFSIQVTTKKTLDLSNKTADWIRAAQETQKNLELSLAKQSNETTAKLIQLAETKKEDPKLQQLQQKWYELNQQLATNLQNQQLKKPKEIWWEKTLLEQLIPQTPKLENKD